MLKKVDHLLVQDIITSIRESEISRSNFRDYMIELGRFLSYEFADTLEKNSISIKTPLGISEGTIIKDKKNIVVINVLRAAIPLVEGIMKVFTESECGVIGAWREDVEPFKVNLNYLRIPSLDNKIVIVADPMLATGNTMNMILDEIKKLGTPKRLVLLTVISSEEGIKSLFKSHPDIEIYTCALDKEVNKEGYIIPGLGDAGDKCFGVPIKKNRLKN
ncbi:uracil phosphoribosyltransferase [Methanobacterium sp.]|uniref:uracil phosphoribosyltransferase n=1 Tax=Methanobacterium sp. TaxID=2164 RepID=UPI003C72BB94